VLNPQPSRTTAHDLWLTARQRQRHRHRHAALEPDRSHPAPARASGRATRCSTFHLGGAPGRAEPDHARIAYFFHGGQGCCKWMDFSPPTRFHCLCRGELEYRARCRGTLRNGGAAELHAVWAAPGAPHSLNRLELAGGGLPAVMGVLDALQRSQVGWISTTSMLSAAAQAQRQPSAPC
jgi:hypothetical protein